MIPAKSIFLNSGQGGKFINSHKRLNHMGKFLRIILDLFKAQKVDKLSFQELSKRRRTKDFDFLYDLHFNKKMSLKEISRAYDYSPPYIRQVFKDQGIQHLVSKNQHKR